MSGNINVVLVAGTAAQMAAVETAYRRPFEPRLSSADIHFGTTYVEGVIDLCSRWEELKKIASARALRATANCAESTSIKLGIGIAGNNDSCAAVFLIKDKNKDREIELSSSSPKSRLEDACFKLLEDSRVLLL